VEHNAILRVSVILCETYCYVQYYFEERKNTVTRRFLRKRLHSCRLTHSVVLRHTLDKAELFGLRWRPSSNNLDGDPSAALEAEDLWHRIPP
jgi:hypothetical protein